MRIAYFTESLPPKPDGVVNTLCRLVETLEKEGIEFLFFSPHKPDADVSWSDRVRKVVSIPFWMYDYYHVGLPYFQPLQAELDAFGPDLIHVVSPTLLGLFGISCARKREKPVVTSYHTHFVRYFSYYGLDQAEELGWKYLRWFHNQCRKTFAPTPSAVQELKLRGIRDVGLWQRGVDVDRFSPVKRDAPMRERLGAGNRPVLLYAGRLVKEKDLDDLIQALHRLKQRGIDFLPVFAGEGPMRSRIEEQIPDSRILGFVHGEELARLYASSDLFVFPSTTETFGNVVLEAFASGIPVVGVDRGGVADLISNGEDGFIARSHDPGHLALMIEILLLQPELRNRFGLEARKKAGLFSWDAINRRMLEECMELTGSGNRRKIFHETACSS